MRSNEYIIYKGQLCPVDAKATRALQKVVKQAAKGIARLRALDEKCKALDAKGEGETWSTKLDQN